MPAPTRQLQTTPVISQQQRVWIGSYNQRLNSSQGAEPAPQSQIGQLLALPITAISLPKSLARQYTASKNSIPLIVQLNPQTSIINNQYLVAPLTASPKEASQLKAQAVDYQLYLGQSNEAALLQECRQVLQQAQRLSLTTILSIRLVTRGLKEDRRHHSLAYAIHLAQRYKAKYVQIVLPRESAAIKELAASADQTHIIISLAETLDPDSLLTAPSSKQEVSTDQLISTTQLITSSGCAGLTTDQSQLPKLTPAVTKRLSGLILGQS